MRVYGIVVFASLVVLGVRSGTAVMQITRPKKGVTTVTPSSQFRSAGGTKAREFVDPRRKSTNRNIVTAGRPDLTASLEVLRSKDAGGTKVPVRVTVDERNARNLKLNQRIKISVRALSGKKERTVPLRVNGGNGWYGYVTLGSRKSVSLTGTVDIKGLPAGVKLAAIVDSRDGEKLVPQHGRVLETNESNNQSRWVSVAARGANLRPLFAGPQPEPPKPGEFRRGAGGIRLAPGQGVRIRGERHSPALAGPQPEPPQPIDFERLERGIVPTPGQSLRNEYRAKGVFFPDGITIFRSGGAEVRRARSGKNVAASRQAGEFKNLPLRVEFTQLQKKVSLNVMHIRSGNGKAAIAELKALDDSGRVVARNRRRFHSDGVNWTPIQLEVRSPLIRRVVLTGGSTEAPDTNFLLVDDLAFSGGIQPNTSTDSRAPVVRILSPTTNSQTADKLTRARVLITDNGYLSNISYKLDREGDGKVAEWKQLAGGINNPIPDKRFETEWQLTLGSRRWDPALGFQSDGFGRYKLTVRARDVAGNESERSVEFDYQAPPSTDVWVLGVEYNQGAQDVVHTDLLRGATSGWVPLQQRMGPDSSLALPITPGKPMVVRVYVGVREPSRNVQQGVPVTGELRIEAAETGGRGRTIRPFQSENCFDHLGNRMPSNNPVTAFPTLGRQGYRTVTPYCIDLIASRIHWGGTLNFVVPAEFTEHLTRGATISVRVNPVGYQESSPQDNAFRLSLQNVAKRESAKLRVVRLSPDGAPAPTTLEVRQVLEDMKLLTKYSQIEVVSNDVFAYRRGQIRVQAKLLGMEIAQHELNECNSLWLMLAQRYGIRKDETILAFLPRTFTPRSCANLQGVGWRIPKPELLRDALSSTGRTDYHGGAAWVFMPNVSLRRSDAPRYWDQVATVAHEFYHAHLDVRHEETGHGEHAGTALSDHGGFADVLKGISDIAGFGIDFDASKPPNHPRGVIGSYPTASVELGRPGLTTGHLSGVVPNSVNLNMVRVAGFLGNMGVRIERYDDSHRLTLYDPCPTGPIDRSRPRSQLTRRINDDNQYGPRIDDEDRPHGFMSYSTNPWISGRPSPNILNLRSAF